MEMNIFLIGMPGSGKTTLGRLYAKQTNRCFIDLDKQIIKQTDACISDIFKDHGEKFFRDLESAELQKIEITQNVVVSTGGGIILKKENREFMKKNGLVIYINRPLDEILNDIDVSNRPLFKGDKQKLFEMFEIRKSLYKSCADAEILNKDINSALTEISSIEQIKNI
jgi:shikimate kinase